MVDQQVRIKENIKSADQINPYEFAFFGQRNQYLLKLFFTLAHALIILQNKNYNKAHKKCCQCTDNHDQPANRISFFIGRIRFVKDIGIAELPVEIHICFFIFIFQISISICFIFNQININLTVPCSFARRLTRPRSARQAFSFAALVA